MTLVFVTISPKPKDIQISIEWRNKKQKILTSKKLDQANVFQFSVTNALNHYLIIKIFF